MVQLYPRNFFFFYLSLIFLISYLKCTNVRNFILESNVISFSSKSFLFFASSYLVNRSSDSSDQRPSSIQLLLLVFKQNKNRHGADNNERLFFSQRQWIRIDLFFFEAADTRKNEQVTSSNLLCEAGFLIKITISIIYPISILRTSIGRHFAYIILVAWDVIISEFLRWNIIGSY